ncbi:MAG: acyl-CoA dehydrogenase family protein [Candidatus Freyarchaeum deiterrae]
MVDFQLSEEQIALRDKARKFAIEEILPVSSKYDKSGEFPLPIYKKAHEAGLMNLAIPKAYGGNGYGALDAVLVIEEIAAADPGIATSMFDNDLGLTPIIIAGTEKQKEKILRPLTEELKFICFATSEPGMGSDVAGLQATCERDGDEYILNGNKFWVTNGNVASLYVFFARLKGTKRYDGICAFVIPRETEGLTPTKPLEKLGHRASNTTAVTLRNVHVPVENRIGDEGIGFLLAMGTFALTRPTIGAFATGLSRSAMEHAINYAKQRDAFEHKISSFQAIQDMVADMYARTEAMRLLVWRAAWQIDQLQDSNIASSCAKLIAAEDSMKIATDALQVYGGKGYLENYRIAKLFRDAKLFSIYEGTTQVQRYVISRFLFKQYQPIMKGF